MSERALKFLVFVVFRIRTPCHLPSCVKHSFIPWILAELWIWQTRPWPLWSFYATEMYKRQVKTYIYQILSDIDKCFIIVVHLLSRVLLFVTPWSAALGHRLPCPSLSLGVFWNSYPLSQWCHPAISSSVIPSLIALNLSQHQSLFQWVGSSHQVAKLLELQHQSFQLIFLRILQSFRIDWLDLLAVQGTLKSFSNTTIWKHQFFSTQHFLWSNSHIHTWLLEKP